jgi:hypothetical protein
MENFSGQSTLSVYQDFHAKVLLKNLVSVLALPVDEILANSMTSRKYDYQINFTQAISKSKDIIALLFQKTTSKIDSIDREFAGYIPENNRTNKTGA